MGCRICALSASFRKNRKLSLETAGIRILPEGAQFRLEIDYGQAVLGGEGRDYCPRGVLEVVDEG